MSSTDVVNRTSRADLKASGVEALRRRLSAIDQGALIAGVALILVIVGAFTVPGMFTLSNYASIARLGAPLGILAIASAIVIMSKNVDLSVVAILGIAAMGVPTFIASYGMVEWQAIGLALIIAIVIGLTNGWMVSVVGVPALVVTLGTWQLFEGLFNFLVSRADFYTVPADAPLITWFGRGDVLGVPAAVVTLLLVSVGAAAMLRFTSFGRMLRAMGDSPAAARLSGVPVRSLVITAFVIAALLGCLCGLVFLGVTGTYSRTYAPGEQLLFNAITAVVIGGVSLSGGRGSILGVLAGTAFISIFVNMMTLLNVGVVESSLIRGIILLAALALDAWLHPRDEETAKSDDL
jgi:ribose transport system permease protein